MSGEPQPRLEHRSAQGRKGGRPVREAALTDRQRVAVLLQGAAVVAHLDHAGCRLATGWSDARVAGEGELRVGGFAKGRVPQPPQRFLRELLVELFRGDDKLAGRGQGRRAARELLERWDQGLAAVAPDRLLGEIFEVAPFLWDPAFGGARRALVGAHRRGARRYLWIVGPGGFRRRVLRAGSRSAAERLVAGAAARELWDGSADETDGQRLAAAGRWRAAVAVWRRDPPKRPTEALALARCLFALGRFSRCLEILKRQRGVEARLLRVRAQSCLGELRAAHRSVRRLAEVPLTPAQELDLVEVAVRVAGNLGRHDEIPAWAERGLAAGRGEHRQRALLIAAGAAWDVGDGEAFEERLRAARPSLDDPDLQWRWHHTRAFPAMGRSDGPEVVACLARALRSRRRLQRHEAGRLWNDMALGRVMADDLAGAERACLHALRLLAGCDGPGRTTLALHNLAEIQLRRGWTANVEPILDAVRSENLRSGNVRALGWDLELRARYELVGGRAAAALALCEEAVGRTGPAAAVERRGVLHLLAVRALAWLGRREQAAERLQRVPKGAFSELEPEERPALWGLVGRLDEACRRAADTPWQPLWYALADERPPSPGSWECLRRLEPYRAARLVVDLELSQAGCVPAQWVLPAMETLRRGGATLLAEKLEGRSLPTWRAVERCLRRATCGPGEVVETLRDAGYADVRLTYRRHGCERVLMEGLGGREVLTRETRGGELHLEAGRVDAPLRALMAALARGYAPAAEDRGPVPSSGQLIGSSPGLRSALERLHKLAAGELPILLLGESGTGKELAAREAHRRSGRSRRRFLPVNCAALSDTLILSELFGHARGAFTGADRDRAGVFESADGGTVFLDEIGDLPLPAQAMLLRVLQEGEIRRVGETAVRKVDVRIVAATHRDLEQMVREGSFRGDLYFRLKVVTIHLPPLRERGDDILLLAEHFLEERSDSPHRLTTEARAALRAHRWPGNVRELRNVLDVAAALASDEVIDVEHLEIPKAQPKGSYHERLDAFRRSALQEALAATAGNQAQAARRLGLTRQALSYLVRQLGL